MKYSSFIGHEQQTLRFLCVYMCTYYAKHIDLTDMHIYTSYMELKTNHVVEQI